MVFSFGFEHPIHFGMFFGIYLTPLLQSAVFLSSRSMPKPWRRKKDACQVKSFCERCYTLFIHNVLFHELGCRGRTPCSRFGFSGNSMFAAAASASSSRHGRVSPFWHI